MTIKQGLKPTIPLTNEYPSIHSENSKSCLKNNDISRNSSSSAAVLETISRFYDALDSSRQNLSPVPEVNGCFAVRLALFLIETISAKKFSLNAAGCFSQVFYRHCLASASQAGLTDEINDNELLVIYIKQCLQLMEKSGILERNRRQARICINAMSPAVLYHRLFNAFWNSTPWEDLFPSDRESARELKATRGILKDLLLRRHGAVALGAIANEYFEMTGFSNRNDLFMISFLDFYFFTWLRHFGMVRYLNEDDLAPVRITVTDSGRKSLNSY
jgi:hypothetical protein